MAPRRRKEDAESSAAKEVEDAKKEVEEAKEKEKEQEEDAAEAVEDDGGAADGAADTIESPKKESHGRTPSVSVQSKLRSEASGRRAHEVLLEMEILRSRLSWRGRTKKLAGEKEEAEKRWKKLEEELQELKRPKEIVVDGLSRLTGRLLRSRSWFVHHSSRSGDLHN